VEHGEEHGEEHSEEHGERLPHLRRIAAIHKRLLSARSDGLNRQVLKMNITLSSRRFLALLLVALLVAPAPAQTQNPTVTINIDAKLNRRPISPLIYGTSWASIAQLADLNLSVNRYGGNATTRYNWQLNATNRASDWYFQSLSDGSETAGELVDTFISNARQAPAIPLITIPMAGWVAKLGPNRGRLASFSIAKYGPQKDNDKQWFPDAGNGIRPDGTKITGNDPNDANTPADENFNRGWVQHLTGKWGKADHGGVRYYVLDNEPGLWQETHRDVHPVGATMDEMRDKMVAYGAMIKSVDPGAIIIGPEEWNWYALLLSGYDIQYSGQNQVNDWNQLPDRKNHGGADFFPWLLDQMRKAEQQTGKRLLDVLSVHHYPQGGESSNDISTAMQLLRNRSTRSLWDPNYTDESWLKYLPQNKIQLIPKLKSWINTYYPGTQTAITEYNWGAENHISGATAQADVLGIFGREGLDIGTFWGSLDPSTPIYKAMKLYRNYDGQKSTFGDTSIAATAPNPDELSAFASIRISDGAMTVMVINKVLSGNTPVNLNLANFAGQGTAQAWQLTAANQINRLSDLALNGNQLTTTVPPQSVTLFVIPVKGGGAATTVSAVNYQRTDLAVEGIVSAFGINLSTVEQGAISLPLPTTLGGTTVMVRDQTGTERLAPLFYVSPKQVNYQIPAGTMAGKVSVTITSADGATSIGVEDVRLVAPGIFSADSTGSGYAAANVQRTTSPNYEQVVRYDEQTRQFVPIPIDLGAPNDGVFLVLYGTGIQKRSALGNVSAKIGGVDAEVLYAGAQGAYVGLDQVNLRIPRSLAGRGDVDVSLIVDGKAANTVKVNIK
jgi:uncharacterized protein (TIGR03437 family)